MKTEFQKEFCIIMSSRSKEDTPFHVSSCLYSVSCLPRWYLHLSELFTGLPQLEAYLELRKDHPNIDAVNISPLYRRLK